jgi:hypothetical protein
MSIGTRPIAPRRFANDAPKPASTTYDPSDFAPSFNSSYLGRAGENNPGDPASDDEDMTEARQNKLEKPRKSSWWWPAGVVASGLAGAAAVAAFRGCWHSKMSWPVGVQGCSYQVCLRCGAMRLFDEKTFSAYGPFRNDLNQLLEWQKSAKPESHPEKGAQSYSL